jgi:hypothetical protein
MPVDLTVDQRAMQNVAKALKAEDDGKALRKDLIKELKIAVAPGVTAVKSQLTSMPSASVPSSPALGSYLASRTVANVRLSGQRTGVAIRIKKTPQLRGFVTASRQLNRASWRHKVFGRDVWVTQQSPIKGFFDETLAKGKEAYKDGVARALDAMAKRIASRTK